MMRRFALVVSLAALAVFGAGSPSRADGPLAPGFNRVYMDTTCAPCRDFFQYSNGAWLATAQIPASYTGIGSARELVDRNSEVLYRTLETARLKAASETDPTLKKLGGYYAACMDSARTEREGATPIAGELARIDAIRDRAGLESYLASLVRRGILQPFNIQVLSDLKNSTMNIANLGQGGLGLPDRDYYTRTDSSSVAMRNEYVAHIGRMFQLTGQPAEAAAKDAAAILEFETRLANASMTRVAMRDPNKLYHKNSVAGLAKDAPGFGWAKFFAAAGLPMLSHPGDSLNVAMPEFMKVAAHEIATAPLEVWKPYLKQHLLGAVGDHLDGKFFAETFSFNSRLTGQRVPQPRWKRCSAEADFAMGEALGQAYVATNCPPAAKARALELVNNLQATMRERIQKLDWMSDVTKTKALEKLDIVLKKIGYPDTWRDYTALQVSADSSYAVNAGHAVGFETVRNLNQIGKPVDRTEWGMSPPTVNAYYNPLVNEIVFPAGILQPPNFDANADDAFNYGAIGMVIGHEITHGFDDQGRQFDAKGNLREWWTADDATKFKARAQKVVDQYNGYVAVDTLHVNGQLTLGENIADLGGITISYYAYQRSLQGKPREIINGFTPEQRFFLGYGQAWRRKLRPETDRLRTLTDPHSPAQWRVNGPLSNVPEFAKAWGCKSTDGMVRSDQITIW